MKPIVKWPGGKRRLVPRIIDLLPDAFGNYYEPFAGGAALTFALLEKGITSPERITVSDVCRPLINAYQAVQYRPELLIGILRQMEAAYRNHGKAYYYEVRDRMNKTLVKNQTEQPAVIAALFLFLNRTCYNGLWRVNSDGELNAPHGSYEKPKIVRAKILLAASQALTGVRFLVAPYNVITSHLIKPADLVYFDPPYFGGFRAYTAEGFNYDAQVKLAGTFRSLANKGVLVIASNADRPKVRELYTGFNFHEVTSPRSINSDPNGRGRVGELIITNF